jgi:hypothetical protein
MKPNEKTEAMKLCRVLTLLKKDKTLDSEDKLFEPILEAVSNGMLEAMETYHEVGSSDKDLQACLNRYAELVSTITDSIKALRDDFKTLETFGMLDAEAEWKGTKVLALIQHHVNEALTREAKVERSVTIGTELCRKEGFQDDPFDGGCPADTR